MDIFTPARVQQARTYYHSLPLAQQYRRTYVYHLVVREEAEPQRRELEQWAAALPATKRRRLPADVAVLAPGLVHTYHELAVGMKLKELGFTIAYEWTIQAIRTHLGTSAPLGDGETDTPDWYVHATAQTPAFIVDVFTADIPGHQAVDTAEVYKVREALAEIAFDAEISILPLRNDVILPHGFVAQVARRVHEWLVDQDPPPGPSLRCGSLNPKRVRLSWPLIWLDQPMVQTLMRAIPATRAIGA